MNKKVAIVTGASRGVGKSVAEYLADLGYFVVLIARNTKMLEQVYNFIVNKGGAATYYSVDVSDPNQVQSSIKNIVSEHSRIDLLFNNAGILKHGTSDLTDEEIDELLRINLNGAIYVAKYVAAQMKNRKMFIL